MEEQPNNFWVEDVQNLTEKVCDIIEADLKKFNITLTEDKKDFIYELFWTELEMLSNGDYKSQN